MITKADLLEALKPIIKKLDNLEAGQLRLEENQSELETRLNTIETRQRISEHGQRALNIKLGELENNIEKKLDEQTATMTSFFHETWASMDRQKQEIEERFQKLEAQPRS